MLRYGFIAFCLLVIISGCKESPHYDNSPAQTQISEYTARLKKCEQEKQELLQQKENLEKQNKINNIQKSSTSTLDSNQPVAIQRSVSMPFKDDMILGDESGKSVVVVEYFSPTCPHCAYYENQVLPALQKKYIDNKSITYVTREFIGNKQDLDAALLARCSGNKDSFFKFVKVILEQQAVWSINKNYRDLLTNIGSLGGISPDAYLKCLNDESLAQILIENTKLVSSMPSFVGTPAFFINGIQYKGPYNLEALSTAIDKAILESKH